MGVEVKDHDRQVILHAERDGGGVEDAQPIDQHLPVGDGWVPLRIGMLHRILVVDAIHLSGLEHHFGTNLYRAQRSSRVGGEVRVPRAGHKDHHASLLEVPYGTSADVRLGYLIHVDGGHYPSRHICTLKCVLKGEAVHSGRKHADVVGSCTIHAGSGSGGHATEDVSAADHDADLHAERRHGLYLLSDECDNCRVNAVFKLPEECLPGELQQNSLIACGFGHAASTAPIMWGLQLLAECVAHEAPYSDVFADRGNRIRD